MLINRLILAIIMMASSLVGAADQPILAAAEQPATVQLQNSQSADLSETGWNEMVSRDGQTTSYLDTDGVHTVYVVVIDSLTNKPIAYVVIGPSQKTKVSHFYKIRYIALEKSTFPADIKLPEGKGCFIGKQGDNIFLLPTTCSSVTIQTIK